MATVSEWESVWAVWRLQVFVQKTHKEYDNSDDNDGN